MAHSDHQQVQNCSSSSSSSLCSETQRGCSKAQNCLFKILRIISTVPPPINSTPSEEKLNGCNGFAAIDLNIGFNNVNVPSEKMVEDSGSPVDGGFVSGQSASASASTTADEKCPVVAECGGVDFGECSDEDGGEKCCESDTYVAQLQSTEIIENLQLENNEISETSDLKDEIGEELKEQQGFMGLLIDAATLIFGDFNDKIPKSDCYTETKSFKSESAIEKLRMDEQHCHDEHDVGVANKQVKRRSNECTEEVIIEDKSSSYPLVRSKRGRIQVLPNKYKDSILEPLTPFSRIRSTIVPNRRRSK